MEKLKWDDAPDWAEAIMIDIYSNCEFYATKERIESGKKAVLSGYEIISYKPNQSEGKKHDTGKPRYSLIPVFSNQELAKVLTFGAEKYGAENWRKVDNHKDRYLSAAIRHIEAYRMGKTTDDESGLHHLAHAKACLSFIIENDLNEKTTQ